MLLSKLAAAKGQGKEQGKGKEKFIDAAAGMAGGMAGGALGKLLNNVDAGCVLCEYVLELMERQVRSKPRLQNGDGYYPGVMDFGGGNQQGYYRVYPGNYLEVGEDITHFSPERVGQQKKLLKHIGNRLRRSHRQESKAAKRKVPWWYRSRTRTRNRGTKDDASSKFVQLSDGTISSKADAATAERTTSLSAAYISHRRDMVQAATEHAASLTTAQQEALQAQKNMGIGIPGLGGSEAAGGLGALGASIPGIGGSEGLSGLSGLSGIPGVGALTAAVSGVSTASANSGKTFPEHRPIIGRFDQKEMDRLENQMTKDGEFSLMYKDLMDAMDDICYRDIPLYYRMAACQYMYSSSDLLVELYLHEYDDRHICQTLPGQCPPNFFDSIASSAGASSGSASSAVSGAMSALGGI
jgi:hypothetical protein